MSTARPALPDPDRAALLESILNLSEYHREHEKFYSVSPREQAVELQRHARTLQALADQWRTTPPSTPSPISPFEGADDLNAPAALQLDGVLFMEGEGEPAEVARLKKSVRDAAVDALQGGKWLSSAMRASWDVAASLLDFEPLSDLLGERHRIIVNNWQAAHMFELAGMLLGRAADILDTVDFAPAAVRADLSAAAASPRRLFSAAEMIGRAADLFSDCAGLIRDNERRWRVFRARVEGLV